MRIPPALAALAAAALVVPACADPTLDVTIVYDRTSADTVEGAVPRLAAASYTISVVTIEDGCDDVAYGRVPPEALLAAQRTTVNASAGRISGVPRLGRKLLLLDGRDRRGVRVAGGCTEVNDIESDTTVEVRAEPALRARLSAEVGGLGDVRDPGLPIVQGEMFDVVLREAIFEGGTPRDRELDVQLRTPAGEARLAPDTDFDVAEVSPGIVRVTLRAAPPADVVGPGELVLRARWADEVLTVPAFFPADQIARHELGGDAARGRNRLAPSWAVLGLPSNVRIAGLSQRADGEPTLSLYARVGTTLGVTAHLPAPDLRAIVAWRHPDTDVVHFITRGRQWMRVDLDATPPALVPLSAAETAPADELHAFPPVCSAGLGLVARAGGRYEGFAKPLEPAPAESFVAHLAATVNALDAPDDTEASITGTSCVTRSDDVTVPIAIVRVENRGGALSTRVVGPDGLDFGVLASDGLSAVGSKKPNSEQAIAVLVGGEVRVGGPTLTVYRILPIGGRDAVVPDLGLEHPLAAPPTSIVWAALDEIAATDTIASLTFGDRTRLQVTLGGDEDHPPLSGVSLALPGTGARLAQAALDNDDRTPLQLLVMTSEVLAAFDLTRPERDP